MRKKPHAQVGVALIAHDGRYLLSRRKPDVHMGGLWEFPGGKCHEGESLEACVRREVLEELDVEVTAPVHFMTHYHEYPEQSVNLVFFHCSIARGKPRAVDCADFRWVKPERFCDFEFPPADAPVIDALIKQLS